MSGAEAIRIHQHGGPEVLTLEEVDVPEPAPHEVVVDQEAVGIDFADTYFRSGLYSTPLPTGLGVEASGVVAAVGTDVTTVAVGDRVTYTGSPLGAYCTRRSMPAASLLALPDAIAADIAAAMTMRGLTTAYLLRRIWPLERGDTVLFHAAAGGVGLLFCQWASLLGLRVIGTVSTEAKAALAAEHGCAHVLQVGRDDVVARVRELTDGAGVRVAYDGVGGESIATSLRCVGHRGLLVCLGTASGPFPPIDAAELGRRGSVYVTRPALADYLADPKERDDLVAELFALVESGELRVRINQRYPLARAADAHRDLEARATTGSSIFDLSLD